MAALLVAVGLIATWGCTRQPPVPQPADLSAVKHANESDFEQIVLQSNLPVLVDFYAEWCPPCRALAPILEELARESTDFQVVKVNADENPGLAQRYGVRGYPTLVVFKNGSQTARQAGIPNAPSSVVKEEVKKMVARG